MSNPETTRIEEDASTLLADPKPKRLWNKNFILLWQGQIVSQIGTQAFTIAMVLWIKDATESPALVGILQMLAFLPGVVLGPIAGTFADRHSRRKIIIICDLLGGLAVLSLAILMLSGFENNDIILKLMFIVAIFVGSTHAFFRPAVTAAMPDLVPFERLEAANSLKEGTFHISTFIGQGIGGVLYRILGAPLLFLFDAFTYLFSAISEYFMKIPQRAKMPDPPHQSVFITIWGELVEGFQYVWSRPGLRNFILALAVLNFFAIPVIALLAFFIEDFLLLPEEWYGFLMAALGLGSILGFAMAGAIKFQPKTRSIISLSMLIGITILLASFGFIRSGFLALGVILLAGVMSGFINITITSIIQKSTPSEIRGRVFGLLATLSGGLIPVAMGLSGIIAETVFNKNIPLLYIVSGAIALVLSLLISTSKDFREFLAYESPSDATQEISESESES